MSNPIIKLNTLLSARGYDKGLYFTHEECTALFSLINSFPRWIPVSERLPENISNVLVLSRGEQLIASYHSEYSLWYVPFVDKPVITHWMPLPNPPEVRE